MCEYWIQYKEWVGVHYQVVSGVVTTDDLQGWYNTNDILPEDIVNVVKL